MCGSEHPEIFDNVKFQKCESTLQYNLNIYLQNLSDNVIRKMASEICFLISEEGKHTVAHGGVYAPKITGLKVVQGLTSDLSFG